MPKTPKSPATRESQRHNPLAEEYVPSLELKQKAPKKNKKRSRDENDGDGYVDSKSSRKILDIAQELADEAESETRAQRPVSSKSNPAFDFGTRLGEDHGEDETAQYEDEDQWGDEDEIVEEVEIDADDLETFNKFLPSDDLSSLKWPGQEAQTSGGGGTDLAALILDKIAQHEAATPQREIRGGGDPEDAVELPEKVVEVYSKVGMILSRYKSGKLPKPFKILPTIPAWETLVAITQPDQWTRTYSPRRMSYHNDIFETADTQC